MDPQIHGAIVAGAIAGPTVALGVALEAWGSTVRQRRADVEAAVELVGLRMPHVLVPLSAVWQRERPDTTDEQSTWAAERERVEQALVRIRLKARWPMRHGKAIRAAATDTLAKYAALIYAYRAHERLITAEDLDVMWGHELAALVFKKVDPIDDQMLGHVRRMRRGGNLTDPVHVLGDDE